jgi:hypothetical protein
MTAQQPVFNLGEVAQIPARSPWDLQFTLYQPDAESTAATYSAVIAATDVVRFRLWTTNDTTPLITATDATPSGGGTSVTINTRGVSETTPARVTVKLSATDTDQAVGTYNFLVDVMDDSDSDRYQPACRGTIKLTNAPA